jgi:nitrous oxidase accessory protein NosD
VEASIQAVSPELILSAPKSTGSVGAAGAAAAGALSAALAAGAVASAADVEAEVADGSSAQAGAREKVNRQSSTHRDTVVINANPLTCVTAQLLSVDYRGKQADRKAWRR